MPRDEARGTVPRYRRCKLGERRGGCAVGELDAELTEAIARAVEDRRDESVWLLQDLVRVPSVTG